MTVGSSAVRYRITEDVPRVEISTLRSGEFSSLNIWNVLIATPIRRTITPPTSNTLNRRVMAISDPTMMPVIVDVTFWVVLRRMWLITSVSLDVYDCCKLGLNRTHAK